MNQVSPARGCNCSWRWEITEPHPTFLPSHAIHSCSTRVFGPSSSQIIVRSKLSIIGTALEILRWVKHAVSRYSRCLSSSVRLSIPEPNKITVATNPSLDEVQAALTPLDLCNLSLDRVCRAKRERPADRVSCWSLWRRSTKSQHMQTMPSEREGERGRERSGVGAGWQRPACGSNHSLRLPERSSGAAGQSSSRRTSALP